jgi:hypothetical protein
MKNVTDIIAALGGNATVAEALHTADQPVIPSVVSEWKRRESIPVKWWPRLIALAAQKSVAGLNADMLMRIHNPEPIITPRPASVTPATMDAARHEEAILSAAPEALP